MKILYLDLNMGAAGDMLSAALYELLTDEQKKDFLRKVNGLGLPGVTVRADPAEKCSIRGTHMTVLAGGAEEADTVCSHMDEERSSHADLSICDHAHDHGQAHDHGHTHDLEHMHGHHHSSLASVNGSIEQMDLPSSVRDHALAVYRMLAEAEGHAHGKKVEEIHFHEVGEKDAVMDVTSVSMLIDMIKPDRIVASPVATGSGTVRCAHGILPVPAPATAYLLERFSIPCFAGPAEGELLTPTGAALIGHFAAQYGKMPEMIIEKTGYGMGKKDFETANCVRAFLGRPAGEDGPDTGRPAGEDGPGTGRPAGEDRPCAGNTVTAESTGRPDDCFTDAIFELSCNLDDMTPEDIAYAGERLFSSGALDVFTSPVGMKKNRPGILLTALCHREQKEAVVQAFFRYTTTLGVREKTCGRYIMRSERRPVALPGQNAVVDVKISEGYGERRIKPEFDQIAAIAGREDVSPAEVRRRVLARIED